MPKVPFLFQIGGVKIIEEKFDGRCLVSDSVGVGKSISALLYYERNPQHSPVVIVCPATIKIKWQREIQDFLEIDSTIIWGTDAPAEYERFPHEFVIINYELLVRKKTRKKKDTRPSWVDHLVEYNPQLVIIDEGQNISNPSAIRTKAVQRLCKKAPKVLILSATPIENKPANIFTMVNILRPDIHEFSSPWVFYENFCLPPDAPITMADMTEKPLGEIKIGEKVLGWKVDTGRKCNRLCPSTVTDVLWETSVLQKVYLENGDVLICTPDHKWATGFHTRGYEYKEATEWNGKGGTHNYASYVLKVFGGTKPVYEESNENYMLGYIHGFFRGDGWCTRDRVLRERFFKEEKFWAYYKYKVGCACSDKESIERIDRYLTYFKVDHGMKRRGDGLYEITRISKEEGYVFISETTTEREDKAWWAGFLGGIYDSEGYGATISQSEEKNPITFKMILKALETFGFSYGINGVRMTIRIHKNRKDILRFWAIANIAARHRLIKHIYGVSARIGEGRETGKDVERAGGYKVVKIERIPGVKRVCTLTTETGNYVAFGYGSKNCNLKRGPWGWEWNGACNLDLLNQLLEEHVLLRRRKEEVLEQLPKLTREVIPLRIDLKKYDEAAGNIVRWMNTFYGKKQYKTKLRTKMNLLKILVADLKLEQQIEWLDEWLRDNDGKIIVGTYHRKIIDQLSQRYSSQCVFIHGGVIGPKRQEAIDSFQTNPKTRIMFGQLKSAGTGWDGTQASAVAVFEMGWNPATHTQLEGRCILEDQLVLTPEGWVPIQNIQIGSKVITAEGTNGTVIDTWSQQCKIEQRETEIIVEGWFLPITTTSEHEFLLENGEWKQAKDLFPGDRIKKPTIQQPPYKISVKFDDDCRINTHHKRFGRIVKNSRLIKAPEEIHLTKDALFTFGFFIGNGWTCDKKESNSGGIGFCGHVKKKDILERCEAWFRKQNLHVSNTINETETCIEKKAYSGEWAKWFRKHFGHGAHHKQLPEFLMDLNKEQSMSILEGLIASDGYVRDNYSELTTVSSKLASQAARLIVNAGLIPTIRYIKNIGSYKSGYAWLVAFANSGKGTSGLVRKVTHKFPTKINGKRRRVYDLTVKEHPSFVVGMSVVHNCNRIGSENPAICYYLVADETIDMTILELNEKKQKIFDQAIDGVEKTDQSFDVFTKTVEALKQRYGGKK